MKKFLDYLKINYLSILELIFFISYIIYLHIPFRESSFGNPNQTYSYLYIYLHLVPQIPLFIFKNNVTLISLSLVGVLGLSSLIIQSIRKKGLPYSFYITNLSIFIFTFVVWVIF